MSQPWHPSPNPGGRNRELVATALSEWFMAQHIGGLNAVQPVPIGPDRVAWEDEGNGTPGPRCQAVIVIPRASEDRVAGTGPDNFGGKMAHYSVELELYYLSGEPNNWREATFDCWRIVDALKDCLRGSGRDIARPDVVLQVGEFPREQSIEDEMDDPISVDGSILFTGMIKFTVSQYMQQQPA